MNKRAFVATLSIAAVALASLPAWAQPSKYPNQPVRLIVPYPAGGGTDFFARTVSQGMGEALGQPVIVENRPGASGMIGGQYVAKLAPADGYTVLWGDMTTFAVNPSLFPKQQQYDIQQDLAPVTMTATFDFMLVVNPKVIPAKTVQELVALAAKSPEGLNYGNPSIGTTHHLATELFARETGAKLVGITYKGGGPAVQDLLAGQIGLMFLDRASAKQHLEAGKLRALAVAGPKRVAEYPDVPTVAESGIKGFNVEGWQGLMVRAGTPAPVIQSIGSAFAKAIAAPGVREKLAAAGIVVTTSTPEQFAAHVRSETVRWGDLVKANGIKAE